MATEGSADVNNAFETATQNFERDLNSGKVNEGSGSSSHSARGSESQAPEIQDLEKLEKFKFDGKEMTFKELKAAALRQQDYTRKTQELSQERKFYENLHYDLAHVRANPSLVAKFRETYPEKFHSYLNEILKEVQTQPGKKQETEVDNSLNERLQRMEGVFREQEVKKIESQIDNVFTKMKGSYGFADEETVLARAQSLLAQPGVTEIDEKTWEGIFKSVHDRNQTRYRDFYKAEVKKQQEASSKGRDSAAGGGAPGQAPKKRTFQQATDDAIRDLSRRT